MKFSKKTAHRLIVSLAMLAPVVYLFGSMFFGLAGAHGEKIYEDEIIIDQTPTYEELMAPDNFRYDAFDWENEHGTRLGFSLGYYLIESRSASYDWNVYFQLNQLGVSAVLYSYDETSCYSEDFINNGLGSFGAVSGEGVIEFDMYYTFAEIGTDAFTGSYGCFYIVGLNTSINNAVAFVWDIEGLQFYYWSNNHWILGSPTTLAFDDFFEGGRFYFDDGRHLPEGIEFDDNLKSYFVPSVKPIEVSSSTYTASIFGQFFPHDNFLERVGVNALSANPIGFAPFGTFLSYLDVNVFHAANSQIALMLYGMVYWSLHVIIADLVYHVAVFIPNIIQRVFDWFGQKGLDDD